MGHSCHQSSGIHGSEHRCSFLPRITAFSTTGRSASHQRMTQVCFDRVTEFPALTQFLSDTLGGTTHEHD